MPLDIACLRGSTSALDTLSWSTDYRHYGSISNAVASSLLKAVAQFTPKSLPRVLGDAKAYDITTDLALVCRLALDLSNNTKPRYDRMASPLLAFLDSDSVIDHLPRIRIWHHPPDGHLWITSRKTVRRWVAYGHAFSIGNHDDILNRNYLLEDHLRASPRPVVNWSTNLFSWKEPDPTIANSTDLAKCLSDDFDTLISEQLSLKRALMIRLKRLSKLLIHYHLEKAAMDYSKIKKAVGHRKLGCRLLSGTPKHIGRLTAFLYQESDRPVVRFAHGGERAFYMDNEWAMSELVNCDIYYAHSTGEARALEKRIRNGTIAASSQAANVEFRSLGSDRHRRIYKEGKRPQHSCRTGQVMYVAGGYLGEALADFASRKPPDILYLDWQISLLKDLRALGYKIITKLHPRGVMPDNSLLAPYSDKVIRGFFDPFEHEVDCLIFDFAGSAFFDALASHHGVVLADTHIRPFDESTKPHLSKRCKIVNVFQDDRGRFRISQDGLDNAIAEASQDAGCSTSFYENYVDQ